MSFPVPSDISQNNIEMLEKQQSLLWLQEATEAHCAKHTAQKARKEVEAKVKKEAKKWRIMEEKKKLKYI